MVEQAVELAAEHGLTVVYPLHLRVKTVDSHHIDLVRMLYNWRLCTTPLDCPSTYDRGWCYLGPDSFKIALEEAQLWPDDDPSNYMPARWYKDVKTQATQPQYFFK
jgi:hypothetical protein